MAGHYSGTINSFADLKGAVESALVAEGWAAASGIYNKGGMYVQLGVIGAGAGTGLALNAGSGQSGGTLVGAAPHPVRIHDWPLADPISWPTGYDIHVCDAPDEVYVVLRHNVQRIQTLAFGRSPAPGNPTGYWINGAGGPSNNFAHAATSYNWQYSNSNNARMSIAPRSREANQAHAVAAGVLASYALSPGVGGNYVAYWYHTGVGWGPTGNEMADGGCSGGAYARLLLDALPNQYNQGTVLVPAYLFEFAADNRSLPVIQLGYLRHCRVDNYNVGDIVEFGPDKWKLYPIGRKDTALRSPGTSVGTSGFYDHTGTFGFAVRYHGP